MGMYIKKPITVEAHQHTGSSSSKHRFHLWMTTGEMPEPGMYNTADIINFFIDTLEGKMEVSPGDWVIKGIAGEFYPCKPDIFEQTYEVAE